jgi:hypothetical protein
MLPVRIPSVSADSHVARSGRQESLIQQPEPVPRVVLEDQVQVSGVGTRSSDQQKSVTSGGNQSGAPDNLKQFSSV